MQYNDITAICKVATKLFTCYLLIQMSLALNFRYKMLPCRLLATT